MTQPLDLRQDQARTLPADATSRPSDIAAMDAVALRGAIAARRVSCAEVMGAALDQIEALNPRVNAIVALRDREALMAEARAADDQLGRAGIAGPLHGFPFAVKDLAGVKGIRAT